MAHLFLSFCNPVTHTSHEEIENDASPAGRHGHVGQKWCLKFAPTSPSTWQKQPYSYIGSRLALKNVIPEIATSFWQSLETKSVFFVGVQEQS